MTHSINISRFSHSHAPPWKCSKDAPTFRNGTLERSRLDSHGDRGNQNYQNRDYRKHINGRGSFMVLLLALFIHPLNASNEPFSPLTLDDAIEYALENNPDLRIASERIAQVKANLGQAQSAFYPQLKTRIAYDHSDNPGRAFAMIVSQRRFNFDLDINHPGEVQNFRPEITATYSLFNGGQDYQRSKAAELGVDTQTLQRSSVRNSLIQTVTSAYYGLLAARESHQVALRSITAIESELKHSQTRYQAGTTLKSDVLSLQVQLAEAQDAEIRANNTIELGRAGLSILLGISATEPFDITASNPPPLPEFNPSFQALQAQALFQRPELLAAHRQVEIRQHQLKATRGAYLPRANAYVSYGQDSAKPRFSSHQDNLSAGIAVELDLFNGFRTREQVSSAEHKLNEAREIEIRTRLNIEHQLKTAWLNLKQALQRVHVTETAVDAAEEAFRLVNEQRKAGAVTVTRYIEAEVARDQTRSRSITARYDALRAEAALKQALGHWR